MKNKSLSYLISCILIIVIVFLGYFAISKFKNNAVLKQENNNQNLSKNQEEVTIQILMTSDIHNKFYPYEYSTNSENTSGSLTQIASAIKELKNENTIIIDVGDTIQDLPIITL